MHPQTPLSTRDQDRPRYGSVQQACLAALTEPGTVADVAERLDWTYDRARSWVHQLLRSGAITRVGFVRTEAGQLAGRYVVTEALLDRRLSALSTLSNRIVL